MERVRADIDQLFASDRELGEVLEEVAHLGVRLLMQVALEAEVTEFLGRERYVPGERAREGSRNGHCVTTIKTTYGQQPGDADLHRSRRGSVHVGYIEVAK